MRAQGKSAQTVRAYLTDLADFAAWFARANDGEELRLEHITALDVQQYRQHLTMKINARRSGGAGEQRSEGVVFRGR